MKLCPTKFAGAGAITSSMMYALCASFLYLKPDLALKLGAQMHLLRSAEIIVPYLDVSAMNVVSGLIQTFVLTFIALWIMASIYNYGIGMSGSCPDSKQPPIIR